MKSVVVASGKGGTGKTTLTALFAHLAQREMQVVVADADVEASNLPLALRVDGAACEAFPGGKKAVIDGSVCIGCGVCLEACRFGAVLQAGNGVSTIHTYTVDPWSCEGCGACAYVCPEAAVRMETRQAGAACEGMSAVGPMAFGRLGPGEDLSGRLVSEVRQRGRRAGEMSVADLLLIDGPPGVGCPVIASVANTDLLVAVTEPTRSGIHDLARLTALAERFNLPVLVILNKSDLSSEGAAALAEECRVRSLTLCAQIPFATDLADALARLADGSLVEEVFGSVPALYHVKEAWRKIKAAVGLPGVEADFDHVAPCERGEP